jgi:hypothetical protein
MTTIQELNALLQKAAETIKSLEGEVKKVQTRPTVVHIPGLSLMKGDKGDQGKVGERGPKGDRGDRGAVGDKGEKGDKGGEGAKGAEGKGEIGPKGPKGDRGPKGDLGIGKAGDRGAVGPKGDKGDRGEKGDSGSGDSPGEIVGKINSLKGMGPHIDAKNIIDIPALIIQSVFAGMTSVNFISGEVVSGSGTSFALTNSPLIFLGLYAQGQKLSTARSDYTINGKNITTAQAWAAGDLEADYYKQ